jgi:hypothetical protein
VKKLFIFLVALMLTSATFAQQIPNAGFETFQTKAGIGFTGPYTYDIPQNWHLGFISDLLAGFGMKPNIGKGTPAQAGSFALKLSSTADTVGADVECSFGLPANSRPGALAGNFRTSGTVTDPDDYGHAFVFMTKWNGTSRDTIGFGGADLASSPTGYTNFTALIQYMNAVQPDSATIYFLYFPDEGNTNIMIDNLSFVNSMGTKKDINSLNQLSLFPNPVTDKATLNIKVQKPVKGTIVIRDMVGKDVKSLPATALNAGANSITLETAGLKNGVYTITLQTENETQTLRFLKQ